MKGRMTMTAKPIINLEYIHDLFDENLDCSELQFDGTCRKCNKETSIVVKLTDKGFDISGGALMRNGGMECDDCFAKTEVYTRVVGYLRPHEQMNTGKRKEIDDRKMFNLSKI